MTRIALLGATLICVLMPPTKGEAQSQPHQYPVAGASGNVAAATAVASLPGASGLTTFLSGFEITSGGATAASCVNATVTGVVGLTLTYSYCAPAGVAAYGLPLIVTFNPPIPANSVNTAISVTLPSLGAGNTNATVTAHGYQQ
jgi:hypothetical protein